MRTARRVANLRAAVFGSVALIAASMMHSPAQSAEIKVFLTGAARGAYEILAPQFERSTGHKLVTVSALPLELVAKAEAGEPFDVIVLSIDVEGLIKKGKVEAASRSVLGQIGVGVAVRAGSPKPDFSTVEKFKQSLLNAKSIATSGEGSSGRFVAGLIERLGIADQVKPKIKSGGPGRSAQLVAAGRSRFRGVRAAAPDRHAQYRVAGFVAAGDQQLRSFHGGPEHGGKGARSRARPAAFPDNSGSDGGLQNEGPRPATVARGEAIAPLSRTCHNWRVD